VAGVSHLMPDSAAAAAAAAAAAGGIVQVPSPPRLLQLPLVRWQQTSSGAGEPARLTGVWLVDWRGGLRFSGTLCQSAYQLVVSHSVSQMVCLSAARVISWLVGGWARGLIHHSWCGQHTQDHRA